MLTGIAAVAGTGAVGTAADRAGEAAGGAGEAAAGEAAATAFVATASVRALASGSRPAVGQVNTIYKANLLRKDMQIIHAIVVTKDEIAAIKAAGASVSPRGRLLALACRQQQQDGACGQDAEPPERRRHRFCP